MSIELIPRKDVLILKEYKKEHKKGVLIIEDRDTKLYQIVDCDVNSDFSINDVVCLSSYPQKVEIRAQIFYVCKEDGVICTVKEEE